MPETEYTKGFQAGKHYEREFVLEYIEAHPKDILEDIKTELEARYRVENRMRLGGMSWDCQ